MFMGQIPSTVDGINHIFSMSVSRNGDIYVVIPAYQFVLKYNKKAMLLIGYIWWRAHSKF